MQANTLLARDHLEQAAIILRSPDHHTRQLRSIIERTIALIDEYERRERLARGNVLDFQRFRVERRLGAP